jgi:hypothetical protein
MSIADLMNRPLTIVARLDLGDTNSDGDEIPTESEVVVLGVLQQVRRDEPDDQGELSDTRWFCALPAGTDITTGDAVICDGERYEVVGDPWRAVDESTGVAHHVEASLRRTGTTADEGAS